MVRQGGELWSSSKVLTIDFFQHGLCTFLNTTNNWEKIFQVVEPTRDFSHSNHQRRWVANLWNRDAAKYRFAISTLFLCIVRKRQQLWYWRFMSPPYNTKPSFDSTGGYRIQVLLFLSCLQLKITFTPMWPILACYGLTILT